MAIPNSRIVTTGLVAACVAIAGLACTAGQPTRAMPVTAGVVATIDTAPEALPVYYDRPYYVIRPAPNYYPYPYGHYVYRYPYGGYYVRPLPRDRYVRRYPPRGHYDRYYYRRYDRLKRHDGRHYGQPSVERKRATPSEDVRAVQKALNALGYGAGAEDGLMGPRTRAAILRFQREQGFADTGTLDNEQKTTLYDMAYAGVSNTDTASRPAAPAPLAEPAVPAAPADAEPADEAPETTADVRDAAGGEDALPPEPLSEPLPSSDEIQRAFADN